MSKRMALMAGALVCLAAPATQAGELRVRVIGLEKAEGAVRAALFTGAEAFEADRPVAGVFLPARTGGVEFSLLLAPGTYSISSFHDRNGNEELDTNLVGIPNEPFGFSNDARGRFGPPSFEAMSFRVGEEPLVLEIRLQ